MFLQTAPGVFSSAPIILTVGATGSLPFAVVAADLDPKLEAEWQAEQKANVVPSVYAV